MLTSFIRSNRAWLLPLLTVVFLSAGCTKNYNDEYQPSASAGSNTGTGSDTGSGCTSVQCHGITKSGARCQRMTTNCSGYCWQH